MNDSVIGTVLARDILQMQLIPKPTLLRHPFALAGHFPAQILSPFDAERAAKRSGEGEPLRLAVIAYPIAGALRSFRGDKGCSPVSGISFNPADRKERTWFA